MEKNMKKIEIVTIAVTMVLLTATMASAKQGIYARQGKFWAKSRLASWPFI